MLNIVIPMAGAGSRFAEAGYELPKPLIPIHGIPMIQVVIDNLKPDQTHRFIFICQALHVELYGLREKLQDFAAGSILIEMNGLSEGAACTVLAAKPYINNGHALMIANCDQYIDLNINHYLHRLNDTTLHGLIMTMNARDPKWSYAAINNEGHVVRVAEKEVISDEATVGIYNFRSGMNFVRAAEEMIAENERVNGEFYVAPVYNRLIHNGEKIGIHNIGTEGAGMHGLGVPTDLSSFVSLPASKSWVQR